MAADMRNNVSAHSREKEGLVAASICVYIGLYDAFCIITAILYHIGGAKPIRAQYSDPVQAEDIR
jgi:hypothetical protein